MSIKLHQLTDLGLKLEIEPIPESSGGLNLRTVTSKPIWNGLRLKTFNEYNNRCAICGFDDTLECHEHWDYDDKDKLQTLTSLVSLCNLCHSLKHMHLLDTIPLEVYNYHFQKINKFKGDEYNEYLESILKVYNERCDHIWTISFGDYEPLIDNDKLLKINDNQWLLRKAILGRG
jgi:hypothetical protein